MNKRKTSRTVKDCELIGPVAQKGRLNLTDSVETATRYQASMRDGETGTCIYY